MPSIVTNITGMLGNLVAMIYAGHLDDSTNLAIMGIAGSVQGVMIWSIMVGINAAQETLTS